MGLYVYLWKRQGQWDEVWRGELWEESKKSNGFIVLFARTVASPC